jgi:hypothetical protein
MNCIQNQWQGLNKLYTTKAFNLEDFDSLCESIVFGKWSALQVSSVCAEKSERRTESLCTEQLCPSDEQHQAYEAGTNKTAVGVGNFCEIGFKSTMMPTTKMH